MAEFGNTFRSAREARGITIEEVAQKTRIAARFLRAIEGEAFAELPGGLFSRGFIRTYASELGLDAEAMVALYASLASETPQSDAQPEVTVPRPVGPARYLGGIAIGAVVLVVLLVALVLRPGSQSDEPGREGGDATPGVAETRPVAPPQAVPAPTVGMNSEPDALSPELTATGETAPPDDAVIDDTVSVTIAEAPADEPQPVVEPPAVTDSEVNEDGDSGSAFNVRVEVHDPTRLYVQLDGQVLYENLMINPPFWRLYTVNDSLELRIADPAAVSLAIDGEAVPTLGPAGQEWAGTLTAESVATLVNR